ncbi:hypothetical protein HMF8227_01735 [Saliniradius amylolyticus]|uniref:Periplasmic or outer membrane protein n=1 Tax=Saliniradius amylolyticus TaxID=2183582 RepID=A0A2S2E3I5_9ALTE|nr:TorF family putative porin [Saliniradius amylolyticus]AWL12208.1 hypothetical protein HMF8227_01735 [Saliniradius amylolyticus]
MKKLTLISALVIASTPAVADWSSTVNLTSDYTFNGVSQTQNDPALQVSLDYAGEEGFYAGAWTSNVDFGEFADLEFDVYAGQYRQLTDELGVDYGIAYYSYHGSSDSSDGNYPEVYSKFNYASALGTSEMNLWYSWDYFGTDAGHSIIELAHTFSLADGHDLRLSWDESASQDKADYQWGTHSSYRHWRAAYMTSYKGFNFSLAYEDTTLDWDTADERVVASVSRTFSF